MVVAEKHQIPGLKMRPALLQQSDFGMVRAELGHSLMFFRA
jgi:hypothetical protein